MAAAQECATDHEGAINKFVCDDKGALMLCAWGIPPLTHVDDPHRATAAAVQVVSQERPHASWKRPHASRKRPHGSWQPPPPLPPFLTALFS